METKERIIERATALFLRLGIKGVTMDDLARDLGLSKKTIYQFFKDKDEIVCTIAKNFLASEEEEMEKIRKESKDPLDELVKISKWMRANLHTIHPSVLFDLKRYHPKAMRILEEHKEKCIRNSVKENLDSGIELGLYRSSMDTDIMSKFRLASSDFAFDQSVYPMRDYKLSDIQSQFFDLFMFGIVSDKGLRLLKSYLGLESKD